MRGKALKERRRRNQELAAADRANRCAWCQIALPSAGAVQLLGDQRKFCSVGCAADAKAFWSKA